MSIRDYEFHDCEAAVLQAGEEGGSEHGVLTVNDVSTEDLTASLGRDTRGDHDRTGDDLMIHPRLDVGRIQEHVREPHVVEGLLAHGRDLPVDVRTDPQHRRLRHARLSPESLDEVIDLPGRRAGHISGHDHAP